ncbi:MAG: polysaccharide deacetylase family protein [Rhodoferax sp.]
MLLLVLALYWGIAPSTARAQTGADSVLLYASAHTERLMTDPKRAYTDVLQQWRKHLRRYGAQAREIGRDELLALPAHAQVLILPSVVALDAQERRAIQQLAQRGVGLLATGLTGSRDERGRDTGLGFLHQTWRITTHGPFEAGGGLFVLPFGDGPLSWTVPAGRRMDVIDNPADAIRVQAPHLAAVVLGWERSQDQMPHGILAYDETSTHRLAYLGLSEFAWPSKTHPSLVALLDASIAWLRRQPQAFKAAWPQAYQAAHLIEMDTEDKFFSATTLARDLERHGFRGTFYSLTSEAVKHPQTVLELLQRGHEVAYHADVHFGFKRLPLAEQELRIQFMIEQMRSIVGDKAGLSTGFRAPTESYDDTTETLLRKHGLRHHAADPAANDDRLPFFSIAETGVDSDAALVVLPRTQWDDVNFTYLRLPVDMISRVLAFDLDLNLRSGAFSLLSVHSQYYVDGAIMQRTMPAYLEKVAAVANRMWVARGDAITQWWRDRAKVQVRQSPRAGGIDVQIQAERPVAGLTVFVTLPRKGARLQWHANAGPQPRVKPLDEFRQALVFEHLGAQAARGHIRFD